MKINKFVLGLIASSFMFIGCDDEETKEKVTENEKDDNEKDDNGEAKADLTGTVKKTLTLSADTLYNLTGKLVVEDGGKLVIPAGTKIQATGGTAAFIAVAQGGKIEVNGTADKPVVMTSAKSSPKAGDWGGLVIAGKAPTNKGASPTTEVGDLKYGGTVKDDNSGTIKYLRLEYTGATTTAEKEFNGLSLFGVGSGTTVDYVLSYEAGDDGIEFFGGTVNGKHLISYNSGDDSIDFADGWQGTGENWYIKGVEKAGIEGSNNGDDGNATPMTEATLKNISIVKGGKTGSENGIYFKEGAGKWTATNVFISGFGTDGAFKIKSEDAPANKRLTDGDLEVEYQLDETTNTTDTGVNGSGLTQKDNQGAGKGAGLPDWATGEWAKGIE